MNTLSYKTISANRNTVTKNWYVVNADGKVLGRLASEIASIIRGKNKPDFTPHVDCGDNVIVINAEKVRLTSNKVEDKVYIRHTGYPGGQRFATPKQLLQKNPGRIIEEAVRGMLPHNRLGRALFTNLFVYVGGEHKHEAQKPIEIELAK